MSKMSKTMEQELIAVDFEKILNEELVRSFEKIFPVGSCFTMCGEIASNVVQRLNKEGYCVQRISN